MFYAEIQNGRQKWRENHLWEMSPIDSAEILVGQKFLTKSFYLAPFPR